ncbi:MAG: hypothetical protein NTY09_05560 [bacterium]|nr:hypothetical protein [bacterium]
MYRYFFVAITAIFIAFILFGCSGNPAQPVIPEVQQVDSSPTQQNHQCAGLYDITINRETGEIVVTPERTALLHLNLTAVYNKTFGISVAFYPALSDLANGLIVFDMSITHPFPANPEFSGFDLKGIMMSPGTVNIGSLIFADLDESRLENADGYTRWWNPSEFTQSGVLGYTSGVLTGTPASTLTATVNPYKLFADALGADDSIDLVTNAPLTSSNGRAVFKNESTDTRRFYLRFAMTPTIQVVYGYAIDVAWWEPVPNPPDNIPADFPMIANQPEAYRIDLTVQKNTLYYETEGGFGGGELVMKANVYDWQGQALADTASQVTSVMFYAPEIMPTGIDAPFQVDTGDHAEYEADLTGIATPTHTGETMIICRVESSDGSTYKQTGAPAPDVPISAFQVMTIDVPELTCAGDANNDFTEAFPITFGTPVDGFVCLPNDYKDFYHFTIPSGSYITGNLELDANADQVLLGIYDNAQTLITEEPVVSGQATIDLFSLGLTPGKYYVRVYTSNASQIVPYILSGDEAIVPITAPTVTEVTPDDMFMDARVVLAHDNYIYCIGDRGIWIYDISTPKTPDLVSYTLQDSLNSNEAVLYYPYLYYYYSSPSGAASNTVNMLDVSDPSNPVLTIDVVPLGGPSDTVCLAINSTNLYVTVNDVYDNVTSSIYDYTSDPDSPAFLASFAGPAYPYDMILTDPEGPDTHLVHSCAFGVQSYSVEDPLAVVQTGNYTFLTNAGRELAAYGNIVYVTHDSGNMIVLEQTPGTLDYKTTLALPVGTNSIDINFPDMYIGSETAGFINCDITTPATPVLNAFYPTISYGGDVAVAGDYIYIIPYQAGLEIFDNSGPGLPLDAGHLPVVNMPLTGQLNGDYLYIPVDEGSYTALKTINIADPSNAHVVYDLKTLDPLSLLALDGNLLAGLGGSSMYVFDVTDPSTPSLLNTQPTTWAGRGLAIKDNIVYAAMFDGTDTLIDAYEVDPCCSYYGSTSISGEVWDLTISGDTLYVQKINSIEIYSLADPYNPSYVGTYALANDSRESEAVGNLLYSVDYDGLEIADITDSEAPVFLNSIEIITPDGFDQVAIDGMYAFIAGFYQAPNTVSIFYPSELIDLGPIYTHPEYQAVDLQVSDGYLYEITPYYGVHIHSIN